MSIFTVFDEMSKKDKDVRIFTHILGTELKGKKGDKYGAVTIQVDEETHQQIAKRMFGIGDKKVHVVFVVADADEYNEISGPKKEKPVKKKSVLDMGLPSRFKR